MSLNKNVLSQKIKDAAAHMRPGENDWTVFALLLLYSFCLLLFTTFSSPLYSFNDWVDINTHFTIGKGLFNGRVHMVDLIDNKGPIIHVIYGFAWLMDRTGHTGVYIMEALFLAISVQYVYKLARLFIGRWEICFFVAIVSPLPLLAAMGNVGGSIEEFTLSIFSISLYYFALYYMKPEALRPIHVALQGVLFMAVFLMKFNLAPFFAGFILVIICELLLSKKFKELGKFVLCFFCGMMVIALPYLIYMLIHGSWHNFIEVYFLLSADYAEIQSAVPLAKFFNALALGINAMNHLWSYALFMILGIIFVLWQTEKGFGIGYCLSAFFLLIGIYLGRAYSPVYIPLFVFLPMGAVMVGVLLEKALKQKHFHVATMLVATLVVLAIIIGRNNLVRHSFFMRWAPAVQPQMAEIIHAYARDDAPSLLQVNYQDYGFYTATGIIPDEPYFTVLNIEHQYLPAMRDSQRDAVRAGHSEFVIVPTGAFDEYPSESRWRLDNHYSPITVLRDADVYWHLYQRSDDYSGLPYFAHYINNIQDPNHVIVLSVKDEAANALDADMQQALHGLGLSETLAEQYFYSYAAIIDGYDIVFEELSPEGISHEQNVAGTDIFVHSAGQEVGNASSIMLDGKEYSRGQRGINIVIFDRATGKIVDNVAFDTCAMPNVPRR